MRKLVSRRALSLALLFAAVMASGCAPVSPPSGQATALSETNTVRLTARLLDMYHLQQGRPDAEIGMHAVDALLQLLDPHRLYLLDEDVQWARAAAGAWPESFRRGDLEQALTVIHRYQERVGERMAYALATLPKNDTLPSAEFGAAERTGSWAADAAALNVRWDQRLAARLAADLQTGLTREQSNAAWAEAYQRTRQRAAEPDRAESVITILQAYAAAYDRHSSFLPPRRSMERRNNALADEEGVGLALRQVGDRFEVAQLIPGGPAASSGLVRQGDIVLAAGDSPEALELTAGRLLEDAVALFRGPSGSRVYLKIARLRHGQAAEIRLVTLQRGPADVAAQRVSAQVLHIPWQGYGHRVGVVRIPSFYIDFAARDRGDSDVRSVVQDVEAVLARLQAEGIAGVVLDLRGNHGGALSEAVEMTAFFMAPAPVALIEQAAKEPVHELVPNEREQVYQGPVAILLDGESASATELFAAALRDRGRAVVLGQRSFGQGSVQTLLELPFVRDAETRGPARLKLTVARIYRVNGRGLDQTGVEPDLLLPTGPDATTGRAVLVGPPLPVKSIDAVDVPVDEQLAQCLPRLQELHQQRLPALEAAARAGNAGEDVALRHAAEIVLELEGLAGSTW